MEPFAFEQLNELIGEKIDSQPEYEDFKNGYW